MTVSYKTNTNPERLKWHQTMSVNVGEFKHTEGNWNASHLYHGVTGEMISGYERQIVARFFSDPRDYEEKLKECHGFIRPEFFSNLRVHQSVEVFKSFRESYPLIFKEVPKEKRGVQEEVLAHVNANGFKLWLPLAPGDSVDYLNIHQICATARAPVTGHKNDVALDGEDMAANVMAYFGRKHAKCYKVYVTSGNKTWCIREEKTEKVISIYISWTDKNGWTEFHKLVRTH